MYLTVASSWRYKCFLSHFPLQKPPCWHHWAGMGVKASLWKNTEVRSGFTLTEPPKMLRSRHGGSRVKSQAILWTDSRTYQDDFGKFWLVNKAIDTVFRWYDWVAQHLKKIFEMKIRSVLHSWYDSVTQNSFRAQTSQVQIHDSGSKKMAEAYPAKLAREKIPTRYQCMVLRIHLLSMRGHKSPEL